MMSENVQTSLPVEIWESVATHLTIDGIEALGLTCRALHELVSTSLKVWRAIVHDLLLVSPNCLSTRSFMTETAESLRKKALRFLRVDRTLSKNDPTQFHSVIDCLEIVPKDPRRMPVTGIHLLPGTPYAAYISEYASVHLVSLDDGHEVNVWMPSEPREFSTASINVYPSTRYGLIVMVTILGQTNAVWLFHVEDAYHSKLSPLLLEDVEAILYSGFGDDTAMLLSVDAVGWRIDVIDVASAVENPGSPPQITRWYLSDDELDRRIAGIQVVRKDLLILCKSEKLHFVSLDATTSTPTGTAYIYQTLEISISIAHHFGPLYEDRNEGKTLVDIASYEECWTIEVPHDYSNVEILSSWRGRHGRMPFSASFVASRCGPRRVVSCVTTGRDDAEGLGVRWTSRPLSTISGVEAEKRLGLPDRTDCSMVEKEQMRDIEYDEWTGINLLTRFGGDVAVVKI